MLSVQVLVRPVVFPAAGLPCRVLQASVMATARNLPVTVTATLTTVNTLYCVPYVRVCRINVRESSANISEGKILDIS